MTNIYISPKLDLLQLEVFFNCLDIIERHNSPFLNPGDHLADHVIFVMNGDNFELSFKEESDIPDHIKRQYIKAHNMVFNIYFRF